MTFLVTWLRGKCPRDPSLTSVVFLSVVGLRSKFLITLKKAATRRCSLKGKRMKSHSLGVAYMSLPSLGGVTRNCTVNLGETEHFRTPGSSLKIRCPEGTMTEEGGRADIGLSGPRAEITALRKPVLILRESLHT